MDSFENTADSGFFGEGEKIVGDQDVRNLESAEDGGVAKEDFDEGGNFSAPLSPWDLGDLTSGSVQGRGFNSDTRASSSGQTGGSLDSVSSETSSRMPPGVLFDAQDSANPGTFSNRVTSQRSIVTSSMSMSSVGGEERSSSSEWGKELWESLQIGTQPPRNKPNNNPINGQNDHRRPNNRFNIDPIITTSSSISNKESFLHTGKSHVDDVGESDGRQNDSDPVADDGTKDSGHQAVVRIKEDPDYNLEPELGLQFPLGDPIVGSAVQDLDISLSDPTTEPSYQLKTTRPSQTINPVKTTSQEPNLPPRRTTSFPQTKPTQPTTPDLVKPSDSSLISSGTSSKNFLQTSESTLRKSTPTPPITSPPNSPTPLATTISETRSSPRYNNDNGPSQFFGSGSRFEKVDFCLNFCQHFLKPEFWKLVSATRLTASRTLKKHMFSDLDIVVAASMQALGGTRCWEEERERQPL